MIIEIKGGSYPGREGLTIYRDPQKERIFITGWYDGGQTLELGFDMPTAEFCARLGLIPAPPK